MKDLNSKREFSGSRLYKLLKVLVITVSLISGVIAILNYNSISNNTLLHSFERTCNELGRESFTENITDAPYYICWETAFKSIDDQTKLMYTTALIAIGLPIISFGGNWLYKYLVTIKKDVDKDNYGNGGGVGGTGGVGVEGGLNLNSEP